VDDALIFVKTAQGAAEVADRGGGLSLQARRVLIMIDGARSLAELAPLVPEGQLVELVELLRGRGLIRRVDEEATAAEAGSGGAARPVSNAGPPTLGTPTAQPGERLYLTVNEVKRRAVRELNERLGADAAVLALLIENSADAEELRQFLRDAEELVARTAGEASAKDFVRAMRRRNS